jgi:hypothetical protein
VTRDSKFEIRNSKFADAPLRTIGVVGDIHCEAEALHTALSFISERSSPSTERATSMSAAGYYRSLASRRCAGTTNVGSLPAK